MFFTFPEDARWNADLQAVEFGVEIGEYRGGSRSRSVCSNGSCPTGPPRSVASRRTTFSEPGSRASPSGSCDGAN